MDFSAFNPQTTNNLSIAARTNDFQAVKQLLQKNNPNHVDNRGWTCLHEAAANDSYESLMLILKHPHCMILVETYEGHTPLYLACKNSASIKTITALLDSEEDIVNYASTEMVTPLHLASAQGRIELIELLLRYGALIDVQDFDGDTPLHDAAFAKQDEAVELLLHAGADPERLNETLHTPFHLACASGSLKTVQALLPFVTDLNNRTLEGDTPLCISAQLGSVDIVKFLLDNNADPHIKNALNDLPLTLTVIHEKVDAFKLLLSVTKMDKMNDDIILLCLQPNYFNCTIAMNLIEADLDQRFFNITENPGATKLCEVGTQQLHYTHNAPINFFLIISRYFYKQSVELFRSLIFIYLMKGVSVNAMHRRECPPLVYVQDCNLDAYFDEILEIFVNHGCDVDYNSLNTPLPDSMIASIVVGGRTIQKLLAYSMVTEPEMVLDIGDRYLDRMYKSDVQNILSLIDVFSEGLTRLNRQNFVPPLKHLSRLVVRKAIRPNVKTPLELIRTVNSLALPTQLKRFVRYQI